MGEENLNVGETSSHYLNVLSIWKHGLDWVFHGESGNSSGQGVRMYASWGRGAGCLPLDLRGLGPVEVRREQARGCGDAEQNWGPSVWLHGRQRYFSPLKIFEVINELHTFRSTLYVIQCKFRSVLLCSPLP